MRIYEKVMKIMFEYETMSAEGIQDLTKGMNVRIIRWMAIYHPTNYVRIILYRLANVRVGEGVAINPRLFIFDNYRSLVVIEDRVSIASDVVIIASSNPNNSMLANIPYVRGKLIKVAPVKIKEDAWIGAGAVILPGITIGKMSIIGAGAVVTKDVPAYSVVAGVPARVIRSLGKMG